MSCSHLYLFSQLQLFLEYVVTNEYGILEYRRKLSGMILHLTNVAEYYTYRCISNVPVHDLYVRICVFVLKNILLQIWPNRPEDGHNSPNDVQEIYFNVYVSYLHYLSLVYCFFLSRQL